MAISDHRSSWPSFDDLTKLISDARVAGMLSGKSGIVHFHVGSAHTKLDLLWKIVNETSIPITQMYPTHLSSRGPELIEESKKWILNGGFCDFTADEKNFVADLLDSFKMDNLPVDKISLSSDAFG